LNCLINQFKKINHFLRVRRSNCTLSSLQLFL